MAVVSISQRKRQRELDIDIEKVTEESRIVGKMIKSQKKSNRYLWSISTSESDSPCTKNLTALQKRQSKLLIKLTQLKG